MLPADSPRKTVHIDVFDRWGTGHVASDMPKTVSGIRSTFNESRDIIRGTFKETLGTILGLLFAFGSLWRLWWRCLRAIISVVSCEKK